MLAFNALMGFAAWAAILALFAAVIALLVFVLWLTWRGLKRVVVAFKAARAADPKRAPRNVRSRGAGDVVAQRLK